MHMTMATVWVRMTDGFRRHVGGGVHRLMSRIESIRIPFSVGLRGRQSTSLLEDFSCHQFHGKSSNPRLGDISRYAIEKDCNAYLTRQSCIWTVSVGCCLPRSHRHKTVENSFNLVTGVSKQDSDGSWAGVIVLHMFGRKADFHGMIVVPFIRFRNDCGSNTAQGAS